MTGDYIYASQKPSSKRSRYYVIAVAIVAIIIGGIYGWYVYQLQPVNAGNHSSVSFEIPAGQRVPVIAQRLKDARLIRDKDAFITYINWHALRSQLEAGSYSLSPDRSAVEIANILSKGKVASNLLVIPEGDTMVQIEQLASKKGIRPSDFKAALADKYDDQYANQRPASVDLEGYLFPDGYQITAQTNAHTLVASMLANLDRKLSPEVVQAFAAEGLTVHQGLTLASIVEREVANSSDRPIVAQVFMSRIKASQALQSDVTVQYAADQAGVAFKLDLASPYNTYVVKGLPIGPICNPGLDAINAAAHPASTDYSYFLAGSDGKTHFAHTFAEHQANIAKYLK